MPKVNDVWNDCGRRCWRAYNEEHEGEVKYKRTRLIRHGRLQCKVDERIRDGQRTNKGLRRDHAKPSVMIGCRVRYAHLAKSGASISRCEGRLLYGGFSHQRTGPYRVRLVTLCSSSRQKESKSGATSVLHLPLSLSLRRASAELSWLVSCDL